MNFYTKFAKRLEKGDIITNLGVVDATTVTGVFVTVWVRGTVWSLASGKGNIQTREITFHEAQEVTVEI